ncbi:TIGR00645 family protein [Oecophyllibacter saccharovorans]|uniref:UPF0114 protein E3202_07375 n=1 Tax=Oecophyllibacter saccharovorans TaxID=2558360 RepID=A0A506ULV2_9PROT|nr:TIGR00645 family protein [Oecophyllibacter saccharovorans]TPW34309.1 TIGR00645 family protein [Oecophyllibacter saccharovorans]
MNKSSHTPSDSRPERQADEAALKAAAAPPDSPRRKSPVSRAKRLEILFERLFFSTRWFVAPIYVGLIGALVIVVGKFLQMLIHLLFGCWSQSFDEVSVQVLDLIDLALLANLVLIVMFAGYENYVSRLDLREHTDFPRWMGHVTFSDIKIKLMASIVAMSAIHLLSDFVRVDELSNRVLAWSLGIHMAFVVSAVLMALMERLAECPGSNAQAQEITALEAVEEGWIAPERAEPRRREGHREESWRQEGWREGEGR